MHRIKLALGLVLTVGLAQLVSGCVAHAGVGGEVVVADPAPSVVYVSPGVWVVENHHSAVFYSDGYYWRRSGAIWYRSSYYDDGFIRVHTRVVPRGIYGVRSHRSYVRYRARSNARRARAARRHNRAVRRDNRQRARDNRRARRDNRRYQKQQRRDNRRYKKQKRRDNRRYKKQKRRDNRRHKKNDRRKKKKDNRRKPVRDYR